MARGGREGQSGARSGRWRGKETGSCAAINSCGCRLGTFRKNSAADNSLSDDNSLARSRPTPRRESSLSDYEFNGFGLRDQEFIANKSIFLALGSQKPKTMVLGNEMVRKEDARLQARTGWLEPSFCLPRQFASLPANMGNGETDMKLISSRGLRLK